jgi:hypothetical protein
MKRGTPVEPAARRELATQCGSTARRVPSPTYLYLLVL